MIAGHTTQALQDFLDLARCYQDVRARRPDVPAVEALSAVRAMMDGDAANLDEALCPGHNFAYTGTQYGGDDERWGGEGRCFCIYCGKDGDG